LDWAFAANCGYVPLGNLHVLLGIGRIQEQLWNCSRKARLLPAETWVCVWFTVQASGSETSQSRIGCGSPAGFVRRCAFVVPVACFRMGSPSRMRSPEQIRAGIESIDSAIRVLRLLGQSQACYVRLQPAATRERPAGALRSTAGQNGFSGSYCRFERRFLVEASTPKQL